jgi:hypothetical protein
MSDTAIAVETGLSLRPMWCSSHPLARSAFLTLRDVVNLEDLRLSREPDSNVGEDGLQVLAEGIELLSRVPDLADAEIPL